MTQKKKIFSRIPRTNTTEANSLLRYSCLVNETHDDMIKAKCLYNVLSDFSTGTTDSSESIRKQIKDFFKNEETDISNIISMTSDMFTLDSFKLDLKEYFKEQDIIDKDKIFKAQRDISEKKIDLIDHKEGNLFI